MALGGSHRNRISNRMVNRLLNAMIRLFNPSCMYANIYIYYDMYMIPHYNL